MITASTASFPTAGPGHSRTSAAASASFAGQLAAIDHARLDPELRADAAMLGNDVARRLFEIEELREYAWNPLLANPGQAIYMLLARDYAPLPERLRSPRRAARGRPRLP